MPWHAQLDLSFAQRDARTLLEHKQHVGPLQVQKALYPEGPGVCHVTVLHPPGGIADGDALRIDAQLREQAAVCLTTPGATKWYRCPQSSSQQSLSFALAPRAVLEWLPRENIFFDAAHVAMNLQVDLAGDSKFLGWEILCFGRRASGESWRNGSLSLSSKIRRNGRLLWSELAQVAASSEFKASAVGLAGFSVCGTLVFAGSNVPPELLARCRAVNRQDAGARAGITLLPSVLVARYLGHSSQEAFNWFTAIWRLLRPELLGRVATPPRLWAC